LGPQSEISGEKMLKVDLGCGKYKLEGFTGVDSVQFGNVDVIHDLETMPYPFKDNSVDEIAARHVVEHLKDPRPLFRECWRILKPEGTLNVKVPHYSGRALYSHPDHKYYNWGYSTPDFLQTESGSDLEWFNRQGEKRLGFKVVSKTLHWTETCGIGNHHLRLRDRFINWLANLQPRLCERIWCYWVGGFCELEFTVKKVV
jgi:SAM-dependent methyltransferase